MKRVVLIMTILAILILDLLAFDDITTGMEPLLYGEYLTIVVSIPILIVFGNQLFQEIKS